MESTLQTIDRITASFLRKSYAPPRVLIVDDSEGIWLTMQTMLARFDCQTVWAPDGLTAFEKLRNQNFDLVFLDLILPGIEGDAVLAEILRSQSAAAVIIMTGHPDAEVMHRCNELGVFAVMVKPFSFTDHMVEDLFRREKIPIRRRCA